MKQLLLILLTLCLSCEATIQTGIWDFTKPQNRKSSVSIEVSKVPSDQEIAEKIFRETQQSITQQAANLKPEDGLYRLQVGDSMAIAVYGEPSSKRRIFVQTTGTIHYLFLPAIQALGKTIPELRQTIQEQLKSYYKYPVVIITPLLFSSGRYTIIGEVNIPGNKPLRGNATVLSALCEAGGFTTRIFRNQTIDLVDLDKSFLSRNGHYIPIDFRRLVKEGDLSQDLPLQAGDYLFMSSQLLSKVYVLGEVRVSLTINYLDPITLAQAIAEAGGTTDRASSRVCVIRGSLATPRWFLIDLNRIVKGDARDFTLFPGDIIYVPPMRFSLLKEILQGGLYAFVNQAFSIAGTVTYLKVNPAALNTNVISPVPVITPIGVPTGGGAIPVSP
jgi:polysaccharide export outer membrane protein